MSGWAPRVGGRKPEIPKRRCAECKRLRKPRTWKTYARPGWCCCRICASRRSYRRCQGIVMSAATKVRRAKELRARVEAAITTLFGELSVREIAIFNRGHKIGYTHGYNRAYRLTRRSYRKKAAA